MSATRTRMLPSPGSAFHRWMTPLARREREVRDTLWLLAAVAWVLLPHLTVLPLWCAASVTALVAWRAWLTWRGHRLPHRFVTIALMCAAGWAVYLQYRTIFGKDAGVAFIVLLLGLKLLEMRARRDISVVVFLCLFVMLTALFESQAMWMAALLLVGLWMLVTALVSAQFVAREPPFRAKAAIALRLCLLALPLMAVLFVLFPRIDGPLWGMPADAYAAKSGLSDSMSPGSFGSLSESTEIAFRVHFDGRVAAPAERYWRGPVFGAYDGRTWRALSERLAAAHTPLVVEADPASVLDYTVTLEANNRPWLFALDAPAAAPVASGMLVRVRPDLQVAALSLVRERTRYTARSFTRYRVGRNETVPHLQQWLELPSGFNPRALAFAARLQNEVGVGGRVGISPPSRPHCCARDGLALSGEPQGGSKPRFAPFEGEGEDGRATLDRKLIERVLAMIREQNFVYTLDPPPLGRNAVDEFLFDTRRGFCEHYASAFVVVMRALDIPARVVTGYQGGEINPVDGNLEVRQRDAHAWAEVWLADQGWVRVDPTAAVAPSRIERGAAETLARAQGFAGFGAQGSWLANLLRQTRFNRDAVGNAWNQWILAYNADRQGGLLSGLGIERIDWQTLTIALIVAFAGVLAGIGVITLARRIEPDPLVALYDHACARIARAARSGDEAKDAQRRPAEGPRDYLARVGARLPEAMRARAAESLALYEALRYAPPRASPATLERFAQSVAALRA